MGGCNFVALKRERLRALVHAAVCELGSSPNGIFARAGASLFLIAVLATCLYWWIDLSERDRHLNEFNTIAAQ